jgi:hypothetical protein
MNAKAGRGEEPARPECAGIRGLQDLDSSGMVNDRLPKKGGKQAARAIVMAAGTAGSFTVWRSLRRNDRH